MQRAWPRFLPWCLLGISVALNAYLATSALEDYRAHSLTRVGAARLLEPEPPYAKAEIVYYGDSRIASWDPLPSAGGRSTANAGVGGETTGMVLDRLERDVLTRQPEVVVIQVGVNDLKVIGISPEREERVFAACLANIERMVARVTESGAKVLLLTVLPAGHSFLRERLLWCQEADAAIERLNRSLLALDSEQVRVVDCASAMGEGGRLESAYSADFLHLNTRGYERLSEIVQGPLERLVER